MQKRPMMESAPGAQTVIDGRKVLYFVGTGYLGLQGRPEVIEAACEAVRRYGMGSATTRMGFGNSPPTIDVEATAAKFFGTESSFYFASGYSAAAVLAQGLEGQVDAVFVDERSHYSVTDALKMLGLPTHQFAHRDATALRESIEKHLGPRQRPLVISDGMFSASGHIAPASEYVDVLKKYEGACLALDDAHGFGTLGAHGRGTLEHLGLLDAAVNSDKDATPRLIMCGTLSKAVGGYGGIVPGSRAFIEHLTRKAAIYFAASAPPAPAAAGTARALRLIMEEPQLLEQLRRNVRQLREGLFGLGLKVEMSPAPIIMLDLGDAERMKRLQTNLLEDGIAIAYMSSYSGIGPHGGLRIAVFATHTPEMIGRLVEAISKAL